MSVNESILLIAHDEVSSVGNQSKAVDRRKRLHGISELRPLPFALCPLSYPCVLVLILSLIRHFIHRKEVPLVLSVSHGGCAALFHAERSLGCVGHGTTSHDSHSL